MILIVDYGMGNLHSVQKAFNRLRIEARITSDTNEISNADKLILPGVGNFKRGMENLTELGLIDALNKAVLENRTSILGICLGMQLFTKSSEEGDCKGLGWIDAKTVRFNFENAEKKLKIPHIGWNTLDFMNESKLYEGIGEDPSFYFVHSFYVASNDDSAVMATTQYGTSFVSSAVKNNIFATQFHPEKSHDDGLKLLKNFAENC
ncbi:MAG TPA: imidazole glycerol phosphate synthase subunit HisH [Flavobacteriales bacterium]|nr:imidazole glycerol phosphate synthase subunit HisH [Flavobacteriales bacterium]